MYNRIPGTQDPGTDAYWLEYDITDLGKRITRTEEWLCSQILFTGKAEIEDFDTGRHLATLDYSPISDTVLSVPWTDPASRPLMI